MTTLLAHNLSSQMRCQLARSLSVNPSIYLPIFWLPVHLTLSPSLPLLLCSAFVFFLARRSSSVFSFTSSFLILFHPSPLFLFYIVHSYSSISLLSRMFSPLFNWSTLPLLLSLTCSMLFLFLRFLSALSSLHYILLSPFAFSSPFSFIHILLHPSLHLPNFPLYVLPSSFFFISSILILPSSHPPEAPSSFTYSISSAFFTSPIFIHLLHFLLSHLHSLSSIYFLKIPYLLPSLS